MIRLLVPLLLLSGCVSAGAPHQEKPAATETRTCEGPACSEKTLVVAIDSPVATQSQELSFKSHGDTLTGEVITPNGIPGPFPGVVILHDLGPLSREGLVRENFGVRLPVEIPIYRAMAEELAANGFAVLIYDKRTCVQSSRIWCPYPRTFLNATKEDIGTVLVDDARAAIAALEARSDVSPAFLGLVGHGQGADLALALQKSGTRVSAIAALSPSLASPSEQVIHQLTTTESALKSRIERQNNADTDELKKQLVRIQGSLAAARAALSADAPKEFGGVEGKVWRSFDKLHAEALANAKTTKAPLLMVIGSMDLNSPDADEESLKRALGSGPRWVSLDGVSHDLVDVSSDATALSPDVVEAVIEFFKEAR